ncbi:MAG: acetolactate decarboxylase [Prolixibacteraceae bacterium]|nr:acetolactate decarboxylase [Prolixibacteraceae bacterium]MBN2772968.1 acetolactate decarboxylase [Prolixibacteraceae bacterium]
MKQIFLIVIVFTFLICNYSCNSDKEKIHEKSDKIYQYSVFTALANKIYDGTITVSDVKKKGDTGLGTFNGLNGEMIVSGGNVFQLLSDGTVQEAGDNIPVPFSVVTFFDNDFSFNITEPVNYEEMKAKIIDNLPSVNSGYTFRIKGKFDRIKCGGAEKQEPPYSKTLSEALVNRPIFESENVNGTLVGFWFPEYTGKINVVGFHLHFISDDRKAAGHVIDFQSSDLSIMIDQCSGFDIELPGTKDFLKSDFDLNQEYSNPSDKK